MMRSILVSIAFFLALVPALLGAQEFEGVIRERIILVPPATITDLLGVEATPDAIERIFELNQEQLLAVLPSNDPTTGTQVIERTVYTRGSMTRMDVRMPRAAIPVAGETSVIIDGDTGLLTLLLHPIRAYMVVTDTTLARQLASLDQVYSGGPGVATTTVERLSGQTIAGVSTEGYEIHAGADMIAQGWTAPAYQGILKVPNLTANDPLATLRDLGLPMRTKMLTRNQGPMEALYGRGYIYLHSEVLSVEREAVEDDRLTVPSGYMLMGLDGAGTASPPSQNRSR